MILFCFFKQKTAYEMRISDWSSDVCSSDLAKAHPFYAMHEHGFVRVATSTPHVRTADVAFNRDAVLAEARRAHACHVDLVVFPELCLSSYAIDDLHLQGAIDRKSTRLNSSH